jgi:hypothetical protein
MLWEYEVKYKVKTDDAHRIIKFIVLEKSKIVKMETTLQLAKHFLYSHQHL